MRGILTAAVATSAIVLAAMSFTPAGAADPCAEDIEKFCKGADPGDRNAILKCIEENEDKLTDECRAYETKMGGGRAERREVVGHLSMLRKACADELDKFCKDPEGHDAALKCLDGHKDELSGACSAAIKTVREEDANINAK